MARIFILGNELDVTSGLVWEVGDRCPTDPGSYLRLWIADGVEVEPVEGWKTCYTCNGKITVAGEIDHGVVIYPADSASSDSDDAYYVLLSSKYGFEVIPSVAAVYNISAYIDPDLNIRNQIAVVRVSDSPVCVGRWTYLNEGPKVYTYLGKDGPEYFGEMDAVVYGAICGNSNAQKLVEMMGWQTQNYG